MTNVKITEGCGTHLHNNSEKGKQFNNFIPLNAEGKEEKKTIHKQILELQPQT